MRYWSVDNAGNVEVAGTVNVSIDVAAPTITGTAFPAPNAAGWNTTPVDVTFTCTDADSGVKSCGPNTKVTKDGSGQVVTGKAVDNVGLEATTGVSVNLDSVAPVTKATLPAGRCERLVPRQDDGDARRHRRHVRCGVTYASVDGAAATAVTAPITLSAAGAHTVKYWSVDKAGNVEAARPWR